MFANILYFLIALVLYSTTELFEPVEGVRNGALFNSLISSALFVLICRVSFERLLKKRDRLTVYQIDQMVGVYINRLSILALVVFAVNLYGFKLYLLFSELTFFERIPSIEAILFLSLFLFYLVAVWSAAFKIQKAFFTVRMSRRHFILSNISFSLPALLPWFVISVVSDLLGFLPYEPLHSFLNSSVGEISYILVFLVTIAIFGPVMIRKIWNCRPLESGAVRDRIDAICKKSGLKYSDILIWNLFGGSMITAGIMGLVGRFRYILVTPALLHSLNGEELDAVMLHEIGHVQRHHMVFYLVFFAGFVGCNFVFFEPALLFLFYGIEPVYQILERVGVEKTTAHPVLFASALIMAFVFYFRVVFGLFMRNCERQADLHPYKFVNDASPLITTFYKIASFSRQSMEKPNWHHFSIGQRVRFLEACQADPGMIQHHHGKVRKMMVGYLVVITLLFSAGYSINYGQSRESFEQFILNRIQYHEMDLDPGNMELYMFIGDSYFKQAEYEKAIRVYEEVLVQMPDNIHALNNLAWYLATCPDEALRDSLKAVAYARKAVDLKREDYILDTYAEALFANNEVEAAFRVAKEALGLAKGRQHYYQEQVDRFEQALKH